MGLALLDYLLCCSFLKMLHNDVFVVLFSVHGFAFKIAVFLIKQMIVEFSTGLELDRAIIQASYQNMIKQELINCV
jgi:hypothetical protein